jgi:hypothetical protein
MSTFQNFIASPLSKQNIENITVGIRKLFNQQHNEYFDIIRILDIDLPKLDETFSFILVEDKDLDVEACFNPLQNAIIARMSVYEGAYSGVARDRFTLCHELMHKALHSPSTLRLNRSNAKIKAFMCPEWQANKGAAALLIPKTMAVNCSTIYEMIDKFGVSNSTATKRSGELDLNLKML